MLARGLAGLSQIEKNPRGTVDAMARRIGRADQTKEPLIRQRSIGERVTHPFIEAAARNVKEAAHDGLIERTPMCLDELLRNSNIP